MKYTTKDSGQRQEYDSGMRRDLQDGKPNFYLCLAKDMDYDSQLLTRWAELMTRGADKYGERNWEKANSVEELERFKASAFRHFMQWINGEEDEDHAAAVFFNVNAAEYVKYRMEEVWYDDFDEWLDSLDTLDDIDDLLKPSAFGPKAPVSTASMNSWTFPEDEKPKPLYKDDLWNDEYCLGCDEKHDYCMCDDYCPECDCEDLLDDYELGFEDGYNKGKEVGKEQAKCCKE